VELAIRPATAADVPLLAEMNRQLCDDEGSRNRMSVAELAVRMQQWLAGDWQAVLFEGPIQTVGYAVYRLGRDDYDPAVLEAYVRQFFIQRELRGRGLGRRAFGLLTTTTFPPGSQIHLEVLASNPRGQHFWESLGFQLYSAALRLTPRIGEG
jgi:ribosomal protein S18 acetylase RimI-like enzyme